MPALLLIASPARSSSCSRKSSTCLWSMSNGESLTSHSSMSSTASVMVGPRSPNSVSHRGHDERSREHEHADEPEEHGPRRQQVRPAAAAQPSRRWREQHREEGRHGDGEYHHPQTFQQRQDRQADDADDDQTPAVRGETIDRGMDRSRRTARRVVSPSGMASNSRSACSTPACRLPGCRPRQSANRRGRGPRPCQPRANCFGVSSVNDARNAELVVQLRSSSGPRTARAGSA